MCRTTEPHRAGAVWRLLARLPALLVAVLVLAVGARAAHAQTEVILQVKVSDDPKKKGAAPDIEATVIEGPGGLPAEKFSLIQADAKGVALRATSLRKYSESSDTIAVVVLVEGHEVWMGNDSYVEVEDDKYAGVFNKLVAAFEPLAKLGPAGSQGALVVYSRGSEPKLPMGPLDKLTGDKLGNQRDYEGKTSRDLVSGVSDGIALLRSVTANRKAMIVIGDGSDTNPEEAKRQLSEQRKLLEQDRIEVYGVQYKAEGIDNETPVIKTLIPTVKAVDSMDGIAAALNEIASRINNRYYLVFPGHDAKLKAGFNWDGNEHDFLLKIDQQEIEAGTLTLSPKWNQPKKKGSFPWAAVLIPLGVILFIVILVKVVSSKPAPTPMPMPIAEVAPAPKPVGPLKTVMIGAGGDAEGFPVVGWIVPLSGPQAYQTFRLLQGVTKIGNAQGVNVVINDGFMTGEHCHIVGSPAGFQLQDNKSTNGSFVNDKRIERHDLVDNDVITLGRTHIVFKSIN